MVQTALQELLAQREKIVDKAVELHDHLEENRDSAKSASSSLQDQITSLSNV